MTDDEAKRAELWERITAEVERRMGPVNAANLALLAGYTVLSDAVRRVTNEGLVPPAASAILVPALEVSYNYLKEGQSHITAATAPIAKPTEHD